MTELSIRTVVSILVPYLSVVIGLYLLQSAWAAILLYHAGMAIALGLGKQSKLLDLIRKGWDAKAAVFVSFLGATGGLLILLVLDTASLDHLDLGGKLAGFGLSGLSFWIFVAYYVTIHPMLEELFWRGYLSRELPYRMLQDVAFAGYHVLVLLIFLKAPWILLSFGLLWLSAWYWRGLCKRLNGLGVAIVSHAVADLSILLAVAYLIRERPM